MKLALVFLILFAIKIVGQNEQPPNALLEEDILGTMAEATRSIAKRYDIEPTCLGGVIGVYIHLMPSPNPKVWPWQMVRMFKSIRDQAVFRGERAFKKICGAGGFSPMATRCSQWGERIGGLSNSISKSKADRERNFVS
ncbi:MAG: hypothetical protein H0X47_12215 [Nitrospirales bacterium]|nr:hypothetical protein [Nitrospirales bacterium]